MKYQTLLLLLLTLLTGAELSALTRSEANDIVLNQVINSSPYNATLVAYSYDPAGAEDLLKAGNVVGAFLSPNLKTTTEDTWFFWIDYLPAKWFVHPAALVFVSDATGAVEVIDVEWWPLLNGLPVYGDHNTRVNSPDIFFGTPPQLTGDNPQQFNFSPFNGGTRGILAAGPADHPASNADLDAMKGALTGGAPGPGLSADNITSTKGSKQNLCDELDALAAMDPPLDKLYFHWTGHGNTTTLFFGDPADAAMSMTYVELANKLKATGALDFCVSIEACQSGGGLATLRDSLGGAGVTSTNSTELAGFTNGGSHFTQAFAGCLGSNGADVDSSGAVSYAEAHAWAKTQSAEANGQDPGLWGMPEIVPTLSEWGLILFTLLLLAFGIVYIRKNKYQMAGATREGAHSSGISWIREVDLRRFPITLLITILLASAAILLVWGSITALDTLGILASSAILAYLWLLIKGE